MGWTKQTGPASMWWDLPIIGDNFAKAGRIIQIYDTPCSPYFEVWVYAFFQAIPTLFITLTKPELVDVDIHKGGHKPRRGRKARFRASAVFRDSLITIPVPRWVVFRVYEMYQRVGWYLLVADALEDFSINWMSMAYKDGGCNQLDVAYFRAVFDNTLQGSSTTPNSRFLIFNTVGSSNVQGTPPARVPVLAGHYRVTWSVTFTPYAVPAQSEIPFGTHLLANNTLVNPGESADYEDGTSFASGNGDITIDPGGSVSLSLCAQWQEPNKFCRSHGTYSLDRVADLELLPDP